MVKLIENFMHKIFKKNIQKFIKKNLSKYDYVYLTSDIRGFLKKYYPMTADQISDLFINILLKNNITVIIPAYSYTSSGKFIVEKKNSNLSYITKWALKKKDIERSVHPIFSVCALGKDKKILRNIGKSAFGFNSFFDKLIKKKTSLLHFGRPFSFGNTVSHYVEQNVGATYRFHKQFKTKVFKKNIYIGTNFSAYVQKYHIGNKKIITNTNKIAKLIKKKNFFVQVGKDKDLTNITHLDLKKTFEFMCQEFYKNKNIFIN